MKRALISAIILAACGFNANGQFGGATRVKPSGATPPAACSYGQLYSTPTALNWCSQAGAWVALGGGGSSTSQGTLASRPAASTAGSLYYPTDSFTVGLDSGSAWANWGPIFRFSAFPTLSSFAWVNQGGATATEEHGGIYLSAPKTSGAQFRVLKKAAPATPYTVTAAFLPQLIGMNYQRIGICLRQSSDGKLMLFYLVYNSGWKLNLDGFTTTAGGGGSAVSTNSFDSPTVLYLRVADSGTTRTWSVSYDGVHWIQYYQDAHTNFLTADEVGFFISEESNTYTAQGMLMSWVEQ